MLPLALFLRHVGLAGLIPIDQAVQLCDDSLLGGRIAHFETVETLFLGFTVRKNEGVLEEGVLTYDNDLVTLKTSRLIYIRI